MSEAIQPVGAIEGAALPQALPPIADVIGPGKVAKAGKNAKGMKLKADPKQGKRLSKKSKTLIFGGLSALSVLILVGIATSGNKAAAPAGAPASSTDQVGMTQAPAPSAAQQRAFIVHATAANGGTGGDASGVPAVPGGTSASLAPHAASGAGAALTQGAALQAGQTPGPTPAEKYHQWLVDNHYKRLEGLVLASQSAHLAKTSAGSMQSSQGGGQFAQQASPTGILALQKRLTETLAQNPQAANDPHVRKLLASLSGLGGLGGLPGAPGANQPSGNQGFLDVQQHQDGNGYLAAVVQPKASNHELFAGSVIPAVLQTGIDSDLPGTITGMVRQTVYDSLNPSIVLIPQGTQVIGAYSNSVAYGQSRVLVAWNRLIFPNGSMIDLKGMVGADGQGESGLGDEVNNHFMRIFGSAILMSLLGVGAQLSQPQNAGAFNTPSASQQAAGALSQQIDSVGTNLLNKNLNLQPTLNIRPGYTFNVLVNRTMILPPYPGN
ncbi:Conjugation TrbI family protein [Thiomonas sp. X19]|uniref:TrbI/VirB10 family protein n=1 Tax=Thiomonas sp. X19 TaxID=1050370 RepID=UPI000B6BB0C6|nr:TrbI/VirB10 family protein [Thiomonas sp. X19]SCC93580.1 Conjugation TrbI family protein [Thiomonas sp. X19]